MTGGPKYSGDDTAAELERFALRAESYRWDGFVGPSASIDLYVAAIKALAEKRKQ
ncbi:hypothetical protein [Methylobacterium brachythecii]|uniref:Uncharacterized protein n=1 Tax=Methylobacterium brachythecii TaxID=1176177 RepID=A0A7W6F9I9_9HYPH|nr:hypothetical protein [Methylobacterium brachythecii]MBB3905570.1 hypothetical protein [Methylobacterium brachythecii]